MESLEFMIDPCFAGKDLRAFLRHQGLSSGMIRRLKQTDGILLDGQPVTVAQILNAGQTLSLILPETPSPYMKPVAMPLTVVYEDSWILVVDKPAGMPVHPSAGHREDTLANGIAYYMQGKPFTFRPVTRLDRYTSGLTLIAKNAVAAAFLCQQVKSGKIEKIYYALTDGIPDPPAGTVDLPIGRVEGSVIAREIRPDGKPALTHYETVATKNGKAWVRVQPVTGRTHQIRVHMAAIGCPLLNDFLYGNQQTEKPFRLVCHQLTFEHPQRKEQISIKNPLELPDFD